jgi:hypothetical protein
VLDAVVDEDAEINSKVIASKIEDVLYSRSLNNELSQSNERVMMSSIVYKYSNINNMNINNVENGVFDIRINNSIKMRNNNASSQRLNYACKDDEEKELCKNVESEFECSECEAVSGVEVNSRWILKDCNENTDIDKSSEFVCKQLEKNALYDYSNCSSNNNLNENKHEESIKKSLSLLLLERVKITLPPATNPPSKLFSINSLCTLILKFIFDMLFYHQLNFKIFFEQLFVVTSIAQLLPPPQPPPISNAIQFHQYTNPTLILISIKNNN